MLKIHNKNEVRGIRNGLSSSEGMKEGKIYKMKFVEIEPTTSLIGEKLRTIIKEK